MSLALSAQRHGLVAARPAAAQDANAIVVTAATASRYHLRSIGDLARAAPDLVFGGPPECRERADCLPGLKRAYGVHFKAFAPTDTGGPLTVQALDSGQIGVALLFTTDPSIQTHHLVILTDNRALQPAENVVPLIRRGTVERYGPRLLAALNAVSARLSTPALRDLDERVETGGQAPRTVADGWLRAHTLITGRQAPQ
jgi:osmoprotectant transport system substrate-binding protein